MATGCIETESAQPHQSTEVLHIEGYTNTPNQVIGFNLLDRRAAAPGSPPAETVIETPTYFRETGELVRGGPVRTASQPEPRLDASGRRTNQYPWSIDLQTTWLTRDDWVSQVSPALNLATSLGRVEIAAYPFDSALVQGTTPFALTPVSSIGDPARSFVAFDNDGVGLVAEGIPVGGWRADRVDVVDDVEFEAGSYDVLMRGPNGGLIPTAVYAVVCHPTQTTLLTGYRTRVGGRLRTLIYNHGGLGGLSGFDFDFCRTMAKAGWRVAMSAYRHQEVTTRYAPGDPASLRADAPTGMDVAKPDAEPAEFCLGEVIDVLRFTDLIRARTDVAPDEILMLGGSHGGCITLRAVAQGAHVKAAVALAPPTEFADGYTWGIPRVPRAWGSYWDATPLARLGLTRADYVAAAVANNEAYWRALMGGLPDTQPEGYDARSATRTVVDLQRRSDVALLLVAQLGDEVVPARHSCMLARLLGADNYFLTDTGELPDHILSVTLDRDAMECVGEGLTWRSGPLPITWSSARPYFLLYRNKAPDRQVPEQDDPPDIRYNSHGSASFVTPFSPATMMSMDSPVHSFIHALFGADHSY